MANAAPISAEYLAAHNHQWVLDAHDVDVAVRKLMPAGAEVGRLFPHGEAVTVAPCIAGKACLVLSPLSEPGASGLHFAGGTAHQDESGTQTALLCGSQRSMLTLSSGVRLDMSHAKLEVLDQLYPSTTYFDLGIPIIYDGADLSMRPTIVAPGVSGDQAAGLWFHVHADLQSLGIPPVFVGCSEGKPVPPIEDMYEACAKAAPFPCHFTLTMRLNRIRFQVGLIPDPQATIPSLDWAKTFFPGGKAFAPGFGVRAVVTSVNSVYAAPSDPQHAANEEIADVAVSGTTSGVCVPAVSGVTPEYITDMGVANLRSAFDTAAGTILDKVGPLFSSTGPQLGDYPCIFSGLGFLNGQSVDPKEECNFIPYCSQGQIEESLAASMTYQMWDWFAGPLGPYPNGAHLGVGAMHVSPTGPTTGTGTPVDIRFDLDDNPDYDSFPTPIDPCPTGWDGVDANGNAKDSDGDGITDGCELCKYSTDNDADGDGRCERTFPGGPITDNCLTAYNPSQLNCNVDAELQRQVGDPTIKLLGDACDPVPCPAQVASSTFRVEVSQPGFGIYCGSFDHSAITVRPLRSYRSPDLQDDPTLDPDTNGHDVTGVPTPARFCFKSATRLTRCDEPTVIRDSLLDTTRCYDDATDPNVSTPTTCTSFEDSEDVYHRMEFLQGGNGTDPNAEPATINYVASASESHSVLDAAVEQHWRWAYAGDYARWNDRKHWLHPDMIDDPPRLEPSKLSGTLWLHADTAVGSHAVPCPLGCITGVHGDELANHYEWYFNPHRAGCNPGDAPLAQCDACRHIHWKVPSDDPWTHPQVDAGDPFHRWDADPGEGSLVLPAADGSWGAIDQLGMLQKLDGVVGPALAQRLADPSVVWVDAAEPSPSMASVPRVPSAVALRLDGGAVVDAAFTGTTALLAAGDMAAGAGGPRPCGPRGSGWGRPGPGCP